MSDHSSTHISRFLHHYFGNREMDEVYVSVFLLSMGQSIISVFVPILLLQLEYTIADIGFFHLLFFLSVLVFLPFTTKLDSVLGLKKTMVLGSLMILPYLFLLNKLSVGDAFWPIAVLNGLWVATYYGAFQVEFSMFVKNNQEAEKSSVIKSIPVFCAALGPIIGATIITKLSFTSLFMVAAALIILSCVPLLVDKDTKIPKQQITAKGVIQADKPTKAAAYQAAGILGIATGVFWPVFIFVNGLSFISLGTIISVSSLLLIFWNIYIGRLADRHDSLVIMGGTLLHAPTWVLRLFLLSPIGIFVSNTLGGFTNNAINIGIDKLVYHQAKKAKNVIEYFLFRELHLEVGRVAVLVVAIVSQNLYWIFGVAAIGTLLNLVMVKNNEVSA